MSTELQQDQQGNRRWSDEARQRFMDIVQSGEIQDDDQIGQLFRETDAFESGLQAARAKMEQEAEAAKPNRLQAARSSLDELNEELTRLKRTPAWLQQSEKTVEKVKELEKRIMAARGEVDAADRDEFSLDVQRKRQELLQEREEIARMAPDADGRRALQAWMGKWQALDNDVRMAKQRRWSRGW